MIQPERISGNAAGADQEKGDHVLYWMQDAVRNEYNHALEYAIDAAPAQRRRSLHRRSVVGTSAFGAWPNDAAAVKAAALLRKQGLEARVLHGGIEAWQQAFPNVKSSSGT